jgi:hypothetical protein
MVMPQALPKQCSVDTELSRVYGSVGVAILLLTEPFKIQKVSSTQNDRLQILETVRPSAECLPVTPPEECNICQISSSGST